MLSRLFVLLLSALLVASCKPKPQESSSNVGDSAESEPAIAAVPASTTTGGLAITAKEPSPHFAEVMSHLDVGGKSLRFNDHEGRDKFWIEAIELLLVMAEASGQDLEIPENFDVATLISQSSLGAKAASGHSVSKDGSSWLMRHYAHYPEGMTPTGEMLGKPKPLTMSSTLPASTDLAFEIHIDCRHLPETYRNNAGLIGSKEEVEEAMSMELPFGMTVGKLLSLCDLHLLIGTEMQKVGTDGMPPALGDYFMELTIPGPLIMAMTPMIEDTLGEVQTMGKHIGWPLPVPEEGGFGKPVLVKKANALRIVSSIEHLEKVDGEGKKLSDDIFYQVSSNHFPEEGNCQLYISPKVMKIAKEWMHVGIEMEEEMRPLAAAIDKIDSSKPWSMFMKVHPTGIETVAEMPYAMNAGTATVATVALGGSSMMFVGARAWKRGSDRAAVILNIRNCQQAMRGEQNMKQLKAGDSFTRKDLEQFMKFPEDIKVEGGWIRFEPGDKIMPESDDPAVNDKHIWLKVSGPGMDGIVGKYGFDNIADVTGW